MTNGEFGCFLAGSILSMVLLMGLLALDNDRRRSVVIQKYKDGEIVCVELNNELICSGAK